MNYSTDLIDAMKTAQNLTSDYKAAQVLGITRGMICNIRAGRRHLAPEQIVKAAELAGIDPKLALMRRYKETIDDLKTRLYVEEIEEQIQGLKDAS
jgi:plasmid maintenance system antidote protein VapI